MHVIITCKYEKEGMKNSREKVETPFFHLNPICYHGNQQLDLAEFQTHPSSHVHVIITYTYEKDCIKNSQEKVATPFFPL